LKGLRAAEKFEFSQFMAVHTAVNSLEALADQQASTLQLRVTRSPLRVLLDHAKSLLMDPNRDAIFDGVKHTISYYANQLEPILQGELSIQNAYLIRPKRAYDIDVLIEDAAKLFSDEVRLSLAPIERYDIAQAGKCLAFEVPTAALFHIFRAADSVLRRYYRCATGIDPKPKMRNWGAYIKNLRSCHANEKILGALEQMKDLHRNPVIHPEAEATIEEALSYIGIAESVISAMVLEINGQPLAPLALAVPATPSATTLLPGPGMFGDADETG
jgi:hypothetical protein